MGSSMINKMHLKIGIMRRRIHHSSDCKRLGQKNLPNKSLPLGILLAQFVVKHCDTHLTKMVRKRPHTPWIMVVAKIALALQWSSALVFSTPLYEGQIEIFVISDGRLLSLLTRPLKGHLLGHFAHHQNT